MLRRTAFTLIEMLLVVAVIVMLISLLMPTLSEARYHASMTVCENNLSQTGTGLTSSAFSNNGRFIPNTFSKPGVIKEGATDLRPALKGHLDFNALKCPFTPQAIDYLTPAITSNVVEWSYIMLTGWRYDGETDGMNRPGDSLRRDGRTIKVLAGDQLWEYAGGQYPHTSHPGRGALKLLTAGANTITPSQIVFPATTWTFSRWENSTANLANGHIDANYALSDGSCVRISNITYNSSNVASVRGFKNGAGVWMLYLPAE